MKKIKQIFGIICYVVAAILVIFAILSVFRNTENRYLKMLDFPRIQFFITALILLIILVVITKQWKWHNYLIAAGLLIAMVINGTYLINYTPLVAVEVAAAGGTASSNNQLSLLLINVKMNNRKSEPLLQLIKRKKPALILAMETDAWWSKNLKVLEKEYPFSQLTINNVAYGMTLYSKLPLEAVQVNYLSNRKVPSFESILTLADGKKITFYAVHPVPPTNFEHLPDNAGQKETSLMQIGMKIKDRKFPTVVAGDLNDVVWGNVDQLTETENLLHDVRVGRGFYNSYNAYNFLMRWPLDHVFVTNEFSLKTLERLPRIGSDHFPIFVELQM